MRCYVKNRFGKFRSNARPMSLSHTVVELFQIEEYADCWLSVECGDLLVYTSQQASLECAVSFHSVVPPAMVIIGDVPGPLPDRNLHLQKNNSAL